MCSLEQQHLLKAVHLESFYAENSQTNSLNQKHLNFLIYMLSTESYSMFISTQ